MRYWELAPEKAATYTQWGPSAMSFFRPITTACLMFSGSIALSAQSATPFSFEVASIKPSGANSVRGSEGGPGTRDPGRYSFGKADLMILIMIAYDVEDFQISSRYPLDRENIDLAAKVPPATTKEQFRLMLQNLLADRFHLKLHIESREFPAYELALAKMRLKLRMASARTEPAPRVWLQDGFPDLPPNRPGMMANNRASAGGFSVRIKAQKQPLARLAEILRTATDRPVVDGTGLTDDFDFTLEFNRDGLNSSPGIAEPQTAPDLNEALQQQLGLQLVNKRVSFDVLVIDSVDRLPTDN